MLILSYIYVDTGTKRILHQLGLSDSQLADFSNNY